MNFDKTMNFKIERDKDVDAQKILKEVYGALVEKGYNPINQLVGYILSGDPTYITSYNDARNKIRQIERGNYPFSNCYGYRKEKDKKY